MKKHNDRILTEADFSDMLPSAFDNSKKQEKSKKPRQQMDWSGLLPDFTTGKQSQASKQPSTTQTTPRIQTGNSQGGLATDLVVQDAQKNGYVGTNQQASAPVLKDGYELFSDITKISSVFDKGIAEKIEKDMENAPTATMVNVNGKAGDLSRGTDKVTIFANNNTVKASKELLREYYMLLKVDQDKHIAYFGTKRNIGDLIVKHVNIGNRVEVIEFKTGKVLAVNADIFKVLFK